MGSYRRALVGAVEKWEPGVQKARLEFPGGKTEMALVLEEISGTVEPGDEVIANTTAVELGLGSGGYHFVLWNLSRDSYEHWSGGHIMKLKYTPLQFDVLSVEEETSDHHGEFESAVDSLEGVPVIAGSLHSQLFAAAVAYRDSVPNGRLVYVMTDGGSLPIRLSQTVGFLKKNGYIQETITCGGAFGGEHESVNIYSGLVAAARVCGADAVVSMMGPGIAGTGTTVGFSGLDQAMILNAACSLGGRPVAIPRITFAETRDRHRGLSHHTISVLTWGTLSRVLVALPKMDAESSLDVKQSLETSGIMEKHDVREVDASSVPGLIEKSGYQPTVMGRNVSEEPNFFMAAGAAGILAADTCAEV